MAALRELEGENPLTTYRREMGETPLLTPEKERSLSQEMERGQMVSILKAYALGEIKAENGMLPLKNSEIIAQEVLGVAGVFGHSVIVEEHRPGDKYSTVVGLRIPDEEVFLENLNNSKFDEYIKKGKEAEHDLIEANLRLVVSIAKKYIGRGFSLSDLIQIGNVGLVEKTPEFSWWRGNKFDTHVTWWIRTAVTHAIDDGGRFVRLPVEVLRDLRNLRKISLQHLMATGVELSEEELSVRSGIPLRRVKYVLDLNYRLAGVASLEKPLGEGDETLGGFVQDPEAKTEAEALDRAEPLEKFTLNVLAAAGLTDRQKSVIALRHGGKKVLSYKMVGKYIGTSGEIARREEKKALEKLRRFVLNDPTLGEYYKDLCE